VIGTVGEAYQLQSAPIVTGPWMYLSPPQLADPTGNIDYTDATPAGQRFYRAVVADP
jgi:hypothetical protein